MKHYDYRTQYTCAQIISFDVDDEKRVHNIKFFGGCDGNLKMISKLVEGWTTDEIKSKLSGNTCGRRPTSCADQLAKAMNIVE